MKLLFFLSVMLLYCGKMLSQTEISYHYKYRLNNVTTIGEAKDITDPMRYRFKTYPTFFDETDLFEFNSERNVSQSQLAELLNAHGYTIAEFHQSVNTTATNPSTPISAPSE